MAGVRKHIHHASRLHLVALHIDQHICVARQRGRVAAHIHDALGAVLGVDGLAYSMSYREIISVRPDVVAAFSHTSG